MPISLWNSGAVEFDSWGSIFLIDCPEPFRTASYPFCYSPKTEATNNGTTTR